MKKKLFELDAELCKKLAIYAAENDLTQVKVVSIALRQFLDPKTIQPDPIQTI